MYECQLCCGGLIWYAETLGLDAGAAHRCGHGTRSVAALNGWLAVGGLDAPVHVAGSRRGCAVIGAIRRPSTERRGPASAQGFDVTGDAEEGESALEQVQRLRPDVVLLDIQAAWDRRIRGRAVPEPPNQHRGWC